MVMDRAPGRSMLTGLTGIGVVTSALGTLRKIPAVLAASMADLYALDPGSVRALLLSPSDVPITLPEMLARCIQL